MRNFAGAGSGDPPDGIRYTVDAVSERLIVEPGEEGPRTGLTGLEVEV